MTQRILIANRGEIARRINRTALAMGRETVAVFADPDAGSPHVAEATVAVNIGPAALAESYLSVESILAAASQTGATAVHPGYGFLSENAAFARAVTGAGMTWIGPKPEAIEQMGSKIEARRLAEAAGVPVIPGYDGPRTGRAASGGRAHRLPGADQSFGWRWWEGHPHCQRTIGVRGCAGRSIYRGRTVLW